MSSLDACEESAQRARELCDGHPSLVAWARALLDLVSDFQYVAENPDAVYQPIRGEAADYIEASRRQAEHSRLWA